MKRIMAMLMSVVLTLGLTACGHTVGDVDLESGQSAIYIQKDGMVSYAVSESFDKDYYDKDELVYALSYGAIGFILFMIYKLIKSD